MKKRSTAEAVREAKLRIKKATAEENGLTYSLSHPFFWAPFVLVGEGGDAPSGKPRTAKGKSKGATSGMASQ